MPYKWIPYATCPKCNNRTELATDNDDMDGAERCPQCKWQINFEPNLHRVRYGTTVEFAADDMNW